jgi:inosose dehydratase
MKIGYTLWTWLMDQHNEWKPMSEYPKRDFEQSLREASDLGYEVFENFNIIVDLYEDDPEEFNRLCKKYEMEFVNIYHYLTDDFLADMKMAERCSKFVKAHGVELMNIQAPWAPKTGTTKELLDDLCSKLTEMGELTQKFGVTMCLHPHYGTTCYTEEEIDYVLEKIGPKLMNLCIDSAHTFLAGMDPKTAFAKYIPRIRFVHLKDVDPKLSAEGETPMRGFVALGQGVLGFRGIVKALKDGGYDGNLIVEVDYNRVCNYETALVSKRYIHQVLGM